MSPPVALTKRWKKIKKRCSFSSSDRLVRSKSFTEQDTINKDQVGAGFSICYFGPQITL